MVAKPKIPQPAILIIDKDQERANRTRETLAPLLELQVKFEAGDGQHARERLAKPQGIEPCLVVTDSEGVKPVRDCVVGKIRKLFGRPRIILYSAHATPEEFEELKAKGLVDEFVRKRERNTTILSTCRRALKEYFADRTLNAMRESLAKHPNAAARYIMIDGRSYSPAAIFSEMIRGTSLGKELLASHKVTIKRQRIRRDAPRRQSNAMSRRMQ
jgi:DNA-binding NarL/FixJ family response regulator